MSHVVSVCWFHFQAPYIGLMYRVSASVRSIFPVLCGMLLVGCVAIPEAPERPALVMPDAFSIDQDIMSADASATAWWEQFNDPVLSAMIAEALKRNTSLDIARANVETARALLAARRLDGTGDFLSTGDVSLGRATGNNRDVEFSGRGNLGFQWEYDAFDRIAALIRSAELDVTAAEQAERDVAVIIAAETAQSYVDFRGAQIRLDVAQRNAALQNESLDLLKVLFENGRATRLDIERAESQYRTTLAALRQLEASLRVSTARLATLTAYPSASVSPLIAEAASVDMAVPELAATLNVDTPEALIRRRADVRAVEAEIGSLLSLGEAERARLFPTITFNADVFALLNDANDFGDSFGFGLGPAIRWEGPDLRRVRADIAIADARTQAAFARYEDTIITALGEVEVALAEYVQAYVQRGDLEAAARSAARAEALARVRFSEGVDDFLDVIDAQRTLLAAEDRLEQNRIETTKRAITTYRALGGVWLNEASEQVAETQE